MSLIFPRILLVCEPARHCRAAQDGRQEASLQSRRLAPGIEREIERRVRRAWPQVRLFCFSAAQKDAHMQAGCQRDGRRQRGGW